MTTIRLFHGIVLHRTPARILQRWSDTLHRRRQLRQLDELSEYLLRDLGLVEHLTREERYRLGGYAGF